MDLEDNEDEQKLGEPEISSLEGQLIPTPEPDEEQNVRKKVEDTINYSSFGYRSNTVTTVTNCLPLSFSGIPQ